MWWDRGLKWMLGWGLFAISLVAFGFAAALYFAFCSLMLGIIYTRVWRPGAVAALARQGVPAGDIDSRLLAQDRGVAAARAAIGLGAAWLLHRYA